MGVITFFLKKIQEKISIFHLRKILRKKAQCDLVGTPPAEAAQGTWRACTQTRTAVLLVQALCTHHPCV